jgi:hypothetical protein
MKTGTINQSMSFDKYAYSWSQPTSTHYQCNFPSTLYYRGCNKISIGGKNYFPEGFERKFFMSGINVPPRLRYLKLDCVMVEDFTLNIKYSDSKDLITEFELYRVVF